MRDRGVWDANTTAADEGSLYTPLWTSDEDAAARDCARDLGIIESRDIDRDIDRDDGASEDEDAPDADDDDDSGDEEDSAWCNACDEEDDAAA